MALTLAVLVVIIGVVLAAEPRLNHNEPRCRYYSDVFLFGCAEYGEPNQPPFLLSVHPPR